MYYAGIGSRETPTEVLEYFQKVARFLAKRGVVLRSGGADGADKAFEIGCDSVRGDKEIYLPWRYFEDSSSDLVVSNPEAYEIAEQLHPYWHNLKDGAKKLQARNTHQVLGWDLKTPSRFIMCWTKNGKGSGGTGQAIRVAEHYGIPVFDAGGYTSLVEVKKNLKEFLITSGVFSKEELAN